MQFGIFYEHQLPRPWQENSEERLVREALEQVELADRLGIDYAWEVEHHFLEEYSHSSAPEVFLAACAARTKRIRLGHGIVLMPPSYNHPARVAERIAMLDLVSGGRVEFGTGESASRIELEGFGIPPAEKRAMWQEAVAEVALMMSETPYPGHDGRYFSMPPRNVLPKPVQKPHPPMWAAATSPQTWELAGRNGIGILGLTIFVSVKQLADRVHAYRAALKEAKPVGKFVNDKVGAFTIVHVAETREQALANGGADAAINYLLYAFRVLGGFADPSGKGMQREYAELEIKSTPYRDLISKEYPLIAKMQRGECTFEELDAEDMVIVGDVDHVIRKVEKYKAAGLDHLLSLMQVDRVQHPAVMKSIELFAKHVMPRFR